VNLATDLLADEEMPQAPSGRLVTIRATGYPVDIADKIGEHRADFPRTLKGNQPILKAEARIAF
jgi:hypothetical protein